MGKGIALQFKQTYPENFRQYEQACYRGEVQLGKMFAVMMNSSFYPRYIVNFPTKWHWRDDSRLEVIEDGLIALVEEIKRLGITSIAIPQLGCGNGHLSWVQVKPLIESAHQQNPKVKMIVFGT